MRSKIISTPKPELGTVVMKPKFLVFPRKINGYWVWWEWVKAIDTYKTVSVPGEWIGYLTDKWVRTYELMFP